MPAERLHRFVSFLDTIFSRSGIRSIRTHVDAC
jgi:hypothetical protein